MKKIIMLASFCAALMAEGMVTGRMDFEHNETSAQARRMRLDNITRNLNARQLKDYFLAYQFVGVFHPYNFFYNLFLNQYSIAYEVDGEPAARAAAKICQMSGVPENEYSRINKVFITVQHYDTGFNSDDDEDNSPQPLLFRPHRIFPH